MVMKQAGEKKGKTAMSGVSPHHEVSVGVSVGMNMTRAVRERSPGAYLVRALEECSAQTSTLGTTTFQENTNVVGYTC
jgi:hypothetical protein